MKKVNIVIPVFNRFEHTKQTLETLIKNTNWEIAHLTVIDDMSTDPKVIEFLRDMESVLPKSEFLLLENSTNLGPAYSRNRACNYLKELNLAYEYLYHSDNDVYFKERWLHDLLTIFENISTDIKVFGASCHPYLQTGSYEYYSTNPNIKICYKDAISGYSQLMEWDTWDKYGPFSDSNRNEERKIMGSEDWAFCQKIIQDGFKVASVEPELVIPTGKTNTYGDLATGSETFKDFSGVFVS